MLILNSLVFFRIIFIIFEIIERTNQFPFCIIIFVLIIYLLFMHFLYWIFHLL
jgi:hypothetical protein